MLGLIDLDAIAATNRVPRATLRSWYRRGRLTPVACEVRTRRLLFDLADVDARLDKHRRRESPWRNNVALSLKDMAAHISVPANNT